MSFSQQTTDVTHFNMKSCRKNSATSHGFTLIEVIIVISIVAILAAFIFPLLKGARRSAWAAVSVSNLRNIGVAMADYGSDHNQIIPPSYYETRGHVDRAWWQFLCPTPSEVSAGEKQYISDKGVFRSPADLTGGEVSYGNTGSTDREIVNGKSILLVKDPSRYVGFVEFHQAGRLVSEHWWVDHPITLEPDKPASAVYPHPGKRTAALHLDFHVELLTYKELKSKPHDFSKQ